MTPGNSSVARAMTVPVNALSSNASPRWPNHLSAKPHAIGTFVLLVLAHIR